MNLSANSIVPQAKMLIAKTLYPEGAIRRVLRGPLRGTRYVAAPAMRARYALMSGLYDEPFLASKTENGDVVFDVGANMGQLTLLFAREVGESGMVLSIEPMEENISFLRRNVELNDLENVTLVEAAASSEKKRVKFKYSNVKSKRVKNGHNKENTREVKSKTLDQISENRNIWPDMIKIDVEGSANEVLSGAKKVLKRRPKIYVEVHNSREYKAVKKEIIGRGYEVKDRSGKEISNIEKGGRHHLWCTVE